MVEWNWYRKCAIWREDTQARQEFYHPNRRRSLCFPLFHKSTKEDTISYQDWCSKIKEDLEKGYESVKVKEAMLTSLEGIAKDNIKMIDEHGDLHITRKLDRLDALHRVAHVLSVTKCHPVWPTAEAI